jgi:hypothetical protein
MNNVEREAEEGYTNMSPSERVMDRKRDPDRVS